MSYLIQKSTDHSLFATPRSLSQLITSFIGAKCQGIRHTPFIAWSIKIEIFEFLFTFFSSGYLDVSVPRVPLYTLCIHVYIPSHYQRWVPSFGNLRINVYLQLPVAYRSLSRPSSAPSAKASTLRSSSLNRIVLKSSNILIRTFEKSVSVFPQQNIIFVNICITLDIFLIFFVFVFSFLEKTICSCQGTN